jgi:protoporphyrinogen oxidase
LTCARALKRSRVPFYLIDAEDRIGGRVKTDVVGGFQVDRGYQVYFSAYPHAKEQLDEDKLKLQRCESGAIVIWDGEQHTLSRDKPLQMALTSLVSTGDKLSLSKWISDVDWTDQDDIDDMTDQTAEEYLREFGFSENFIDRFARPFFGGVFLDRSLSFSAKQLVFVWKYLCEGYAAVPEMGMEELPKQLGSTFGYDVLHLGAKVDEILMLDGRVAAVKLENGDSIEADQVVLACDAVNAAKLSGVSIPVEFKHSITLYFTAPEAPCQKGLLVLNGNVRGITNHVMPHFAESGGKVLVSATILGERTETDDQLADIVKSELRLWFPDQDVDAWEFLRGYRNRCAQMAQPPGFRDVLPSNDSGVPGLYFAGEFTTNSSIDGAIQSGLDCAELILSRMTAGVA